MTRPVGVGEWQLLQLTLLLLCVVCIDCQDDEDLLEWQSVHELTLAGISW